MNAKLILLSTVTSTLMTTAAWAQPSCPPGQILVVDAVTHKPICVKPNTPQPQTQQQQAQPQPQQPGQQPPQAYQPAPVAPVPNAPQPPVAQPYKPATTQQPYKPAPVAPVPNAPQQTVAQPYKPATPQQPYQPAPVAPAPAAPQQPVAQPYKPATPQQPYQPAPVAPVLNAPQQTVVSNAPQQPVAQPASAAVTPTTPVAAHPQPATINIQYFIIGDPGEEFKCEYIEENFKNCVTATENDLKTVPNFMDYLKGRVASPAPEAQVVSNTPPSPVPTQAQAYQPPAATVPPPTAPLPPPTPYIPPEQRAQSNDTNKETPIEPPVEPKIQYSNGKRNAGEFFMGLLFTGLAGVSGLVFYYAGKKEIYEYYDDAGIKQQKMYEGYDIADNYRNAIILTHALSVPCAGSGVHLGGALAGTAGKGWTPYFGAFLGAAAGWGLTYVWDKLSTKIRPYAPTVISPMLALLGAWTAYEISHHIHKNDEKNETASSVLIYPSLVATPDLQMAGLNIVF